MSSDGSHGWYLMAGVAEGKSDDDWGKMRYLGPNCLHWMHVLSG